MAVLLSLPHEILQYIFAEVRATDLAGLSLACRELHKFIQGNTLLWRSVYLNHFDEPTLVPGLIRPEPDWERDLQGLMNAGKILRSDDADSKAKNFKTIGEKLANLVRDASPLHRSTSSNIDFLNEMFSKSQNKELFLCGSALFGRLRPPAKSDVLLSFKDRQLSAKLHSLYGVPITHGPITVATRSSRTYPIACSKVYDLRNYTDKTMWGPFMEDGSGNVDWERVEAIMVVLGHNLEIFKKRTNGMYDCWRRTFVESVPNSYHSHQIMTPNLNYFNPLCAQDPYNITGQWTRIVTFLDFTELFAYNFAFGQPAIGEPRAPLDTTEAIRLITMELKVTKIEKPGPDDGQDLPVVHFEGTSKSMHSSWDPNANSGIRGSHEIGTVRLTKEGEVRWTSFSIYQGEERWRSEGVQIGGPCSTRGVIGNWFDKDFDIHGPAGPTAYWKISDEISVEEDIDSEDDEALDPDFTNDGAEEGEDDTSEDGEDGEEVTHQALLDMITHIHAHHHGGNGVQGMVNGEGVFTGLNGLGVQLVLEQQTEEVEGEDIQMAVVSQSQTNDHDFGLEDVVGSQETRLDGGSSQMNVVNSTQEQSHTPDNGPQQIQPS